MYEYTGNPHFLIVRAQCLLDGRGDEDDAEAAALAAAYSTSGFPTERARLFTYLGARAADRDEWDIAEKHLTEALLLRADSAPAEVWRVILAQVKQGKLRRAANTFADYRPTVNNRDEAQLWLQANATVAWDEAKASEALTLARRFNDPQLSVALLGQIVMRTRGVVEDSESQPASDANPQVDANLEERRRAVQRAVPAELHRQAFAAMEQLVGEFGEATGITVLRGEPEQQVEQMVSQLRETATAAASLMDLIAAARDARLPRGFLATSRGQSYATMLIQRSLGPLISGAADDDEHMLDVQSAANAVGRPVVVDSSALLVLTGMSSPARLEGQFTAMQLPAGAMRDIHRATFDIRGLASSPGTVSWDLQLGSAVFQELGEAEFTRQLRLAEDLEDLAQSLTARIVNDLTLFESLGDDVEHASWLEPIQLAHNQGVALWSDDLGLRRLARQTGVACFGTPALIDALRDTALETASTREAQDVVLRQTAADNRELALDLVVDVALHLEDLLHIAEQDDWLPRAAGVVLTRASWWAWQTTPVQDLMAFYEQISAHRPNSLPDWQYAAMIGAARAFQPADAAAKMLAALALLGYRTGPTTDEVVDCVRRARQVADEFGLPDPLAQLPAASALARVGRLSQPEASVNAVLARFWEQT